MNNKKEIFVANVPRQLSRQNAKTQKVRGKKTGTVETAPSVAGAGISCTSPLEFSSIDEWEKSDEFKSLKNPNRDCFFMIHDEGKLSVITR